MARFVQLPNKVVVDLDNIAYVLQQELNAYMIVPKVSISTAVPKLTGDDFAVLVKFLEDDKQLVVLTLPSKVVSA
jgi:predicted signal transduction protein with EAL and GGDEF domain